MVILLGADYDLSLFQAVEDLQLQALVPEFPVEAPTIPVLPWAAWLNVQGLGPELRQPLPQSPGNHLGAVVAPNMLRDALGHHGVRQRPDHTEAVDPPRYPQGEAFARVLVNQRHDPQTPSIMGAPLDEVEAPDMIGSLGPQPNARAIVEP